MKWFWNPCRARRRQICLLACGAPPVKKNPALERHLAACAECRAYFHEIKRTAQAVAALPARFSRLEPDDKMKMRWASAVQAASRPRPAGRHAPANFLRDLWRELIWPCRHAWAGMAALWLMMLLLHGQFSAGPILPAGVSLPNATAAYPSWQEQNRIVAELVEPPARPAEPALPPRPHSERETNCRVG